MSIAKSCEPSPKNFKWVCFVYERLSHLTTLADCRPVIFCLIYFLSVMITLPSEVFRETTKRKMRGKLVVGIRDWSRIASSLAGVENNDGYATIMANRSLRWREYCAENQNEWHIKALFKISLVSEKSCYEEVWSKTIQFIYFLLFPYFLIYFHVN